MKGFHNIGDDWSDLNCDKFIDTIKEEAEARPGHTIIGACGVWSVCFSIDPGKVGKIFSARLRVSRSKDRDWHILGRMAKRIGAPEQEIDDTITTAPEVAHYWVWDSQASMETIRKIVGLMRGSADHLLIGARRPS